MPNDTTYCPHCNTWQNEENNKAEHKNNSEVVNHKGNQKTYNKEAKYLVEGEEIVAKAKWTLVPFILSWGLIILIEIILTKLYGMESYRVYLTNGLSLVINLTSTCIAIIIITLFICALSILLFLLRRELVVTNKKIYGRIGLIATKQFIIPLNKINYISVRYNILTRLLNSASFIVYPGNSFWGIHFNYVAHANDFKKAVEKAIYSNK